MKTQFLNIHQNILKTFIAFGFMMLLSLLTNPLKAQTLEKTVTGVVRSTDGAVPMATVYLKGTRIAVICDENGKFTFPQKLKKDDVLIASSLGYEDAIIRIESNTTFIEPFLEDIPLVIIGALRTKKIKESSTLDHK